MALRVGQGDPLSLVAQIGAVLSEVDPVVPLSGVSTMKQTVDGALTEISFLSLLLVLAAGVAVLLVMVGRYGVISYWVASCLLPGLVVGAQPTGLRVQLAGGGGSGSHLTGRVRGSAAPSVRYRSRLKAECSRAPYQKTAKWWSKEAA